jgi:hypothetical protein
MKFLPIFLSLSVIHKVYADFRVPILTQPLATFNLPFLEGFMATNQAYYDRVTTYDVWKTPKADGDQISAFEVIDSGVYRPNHGFRR